MVLVTVPSADLVIRSAIKVHAELGPGLFETVYTPCLVHELRKAGARVREQVRVPLSYDGLVFDCAFRADLIVEDELIVEIKSVDTLAPVHYKQLLTYLRLSRIKKGLLINFNETLLKNGLKSVVA